MASQYTTVKLEVTSTLTSALDLVNVVSPLDYVAGFDLKTGTGSGQADMQWSDERTLAASASEDLDLAGSLTGPVGSTLTFARIKGILIKAKSTNTNNVVVSSPASNAAPLFGGTTGSISLAPGEIFAWFAPVGGGKVVTPATGDLVHVANSGAGTSVDYDVIVI